MSRRTLIRSTAAIAALLAGSATSAETKFGADIGVNGGYATNPYGSEIDSTGSGTLSGTFTPTLVILTPTGSTQLGGNITHTEYSKLYDGTTDYTGSASTTQQLSPRVSLTAGASYSSYVRNGLYPVFAPVIGGPLVPGDPIILDPGAGASLSERTNVLSGHLGMGFTLSPRDTLNVSARGTRLRFPDATVFSQDYDSYGGGLSYMRAIGAKTSIGVGLDVAKNDYLDGAFGDSTQYSPTARISTRLSPRVSLNATAGVTFSESSYPTGSVSGTSFMGSVDLCREGDRVRFCFSGSHGVSPSSISGSSQVTSAGASYHYAINTRSNLNASVSYARSRGLDGINSFGTDYAQASVGYDRQILPRLSAVASVTYSDTYDSFVTRGANIHGLLGVKYRLGQN